MIKQFMMTTVSVLSILLVNTVNAAGSGKKDLPPPPTHFGNENINPERAAKIEKALTPPPTRKSREEMDRDRLAQLNREDIKKGHRPIVPSPRVQHFVPMERAR